MCLAFVFACGSPAGADDSSSAAATGKAAPDKPQKPGGEPFGEGDALIIVDVQKDFLSGGSLAVPRGDEIIAVVNKYVDAFNAKHLPVFATRDWHPSGHCSFKQDPPVACADASQGGRWPAHCVQGTPGADFAEGLHVQGARVFSKGTDPNVDSYSGFGGVELETGIGLASALSSAGVRRVFVSGVATDYCVRATVLDALKANFSAVLLDDAARAVNVTAGDGPRAKREMMESGARIGDWVAPPIDFSQCDPALKCPTPASDCSGPWDTQGHPSSSACPDAATSLKGDSCKEVMFGLKEDVGNFRGCESSYVTLNLADSGWSQNVNDDFVACAAAGRLGGDCGVIGFASPASHVTPTRATTYRELCQLRACGCDISVDEDGVGTIGHCGATSP